MKNKSMKQVSAAANIQRHTDRANKTGGIEIAALSRRGWTRAVLVAALALAIVPRRRMHSSRSR